MEVTTLGQTAANLALSVAYALVTVVLAVGTLAWVDRVFYRQIDFVQEMRTATSPPPSSTARCSSSSP